MQEIEVGSFVPARVIPQLADTAGDRRSGAGVVPNLTVQALAPNLRGVQNAYNAGVHKISIPVSVSEGHSRANLNRTPAQSIVMMRESWTGCTHSRGKCRWWRALRRHSDAPSTAW